MGIPKLEAAAIYVSLIEARAILIPPEADPVTPAKVVIVTASLTSGSWIAEAKPSFKDLNPGKAAITPPKPYSEAVFRVASNAPAIDRLIRALKFTLILRNARPITTIIPINKAASTAQIAASLGISTGDTPVIPIAEKSKLLP